MSKILIIGANMLFARTDWLQRKQGRAEKDGTCSFYVFSVHLRRIMAICGSLYKLRTKKHSKQSEMFKYK